MISESDGNYGTLFDRVAKGSDIENTQTRYRTPRANALGERFVGRVRRQCLALVLVLGERQLYRVIKEYVQFFNEARPHQGIEQQIVTSSARPDKVFGKDSRPQPKIRGCGFFCEFSVFTETHSQCVLSMGLVNSQLAQAKSGRKRQTKSVNDSRSEICPSVL